MFKKPFTVNLAHKVSGADRKKIRRGLQAHYEHLTEEDLELVLPSKAGDLEQVKLAAPSRAVIYLLDKIPLFLDTSGKGDIVPTVFALWKLPKLLPQVYLKHPAVSTYVVGGADLMLPGVYMPQEGLQAFQKDDLVSVCIHGNPCPIGVGSALMSSADAMKRAAAGQKGKLLEMIQVYGDLLWADLGGRAVPNEGFLADAVVPLGFGSVEEALQAGDDGAELATAGATDAERQPADLPSAEAADEMQKIELKDDQTWEDLPSMPDVAEQPVQAAGDSEAGSSSAAAASWGSRPEEMDDLLQTCLLQALHKAVKDEHLPLNPSVLWNQHMLPVRPAGSNLDVKKSTHKKMSTFLKAYNKLGLLQTKEDKHSGDIIVTSINRNHDLYSTFKPYKAGMQAANAASVASNPAESRPGPPTGSGPSPADELHVEEVYKPQKELRPVFEALGIPHDAVYTVQEAGEIAFAYVKHAKLDENVPDNRTIMLDAIMCDALFKGLIKKGELYPTHLQKAELKEAFLKRMQPQCRITRGQFQIFKKGGAPTVHISSEKRAGNKRITKIIGVEDFLVDPEHVATACSKKYACSTSVSQLPGKHQGQEIVLQGSVVDEVADYLVKTYGIPKKYVQVKK